MNAREIDLQKDRARRADQETRKNVRAQEEKTQLMRPPASAPALANPVPRKRILRATEIFAHPDAKKTFFRVGSVAQISDDVPDDLAQYRKKVCMIRHMHFIEMEQNKNFLVMIVSFKSTTAAADAMMDQVHAKHFCKGREELFNHFTVPPGTLVICFESYLTPCPMGTHLSRIGDPETRKRQHADCEKAPEQHKKQAQAAQELQSAIGLLLNLKKQPSPGKEALVQHESEDAESEDEDSGLQIDESSDEDVDL